MSHDPFSQFSLFDLFRQEAENQCALLDAGLLALERDPRDAVQLEALMRAAHSLKGAARIVGLDAAVRVAHAMEDCFVSAQDGSITLQPEVNDLLLKSTDLLRRISQVSEEEIGSWEAENSAELDQSVGALQALLIGAAVPLELPVSILIEKTPDTQISAEKPVGSVLPPEPRDRVLRVTAANLNRLLGLAAESLVESRWLKPYADSLLRLKRQQWKLLQMLEELRESQAELDEASRERLAAAQQLSANCMQGLSDRHAELELFARRSSNLSHRLYSEALASRMRPFSDGTTGFARLVRDLSRQLGKEIRLEIAGEATSVDRDVLEQLEAPLTHLLRNAVDHGLESPLERGRDGKPREGTLKLEARHLAGALCVTVEDDGKGISLDCLRESILRKRLTSADVIEKLSEEELLDFLFLPGFSMKETVTEISGRGVGLDVVQNMVKAVGGNVRISTQFGHGTRFQLQLPLTLSVLRALLVQIGGEPYGFPLVRIQAALRVPRSQIETLEGREHIPYGGDRIGLIPASQLLGKSAATVDEEVSVVVLGEKGRQFGVAVEQLLGERELVVQPLDPRLGKIKDISAGALMPDGSPLLVIDVEDLLRSIDVLVSGGGLKRVQPSGASRAQRQRKRVLVVEDSLTVRELERKLLGEAGYEVDVAVDGMDGWNAIRTQPYDLVLTDIDMPRLDGIELVRLIKKDARLFSIPVMIVSYKDRPEDRHRGLEAGADYYLTKGSFHDETLLGAVADLIGRADESEPLDPPPRS